MDDRATLLTGLARYAYQYRPDKPFLLVSGKTSPEYLDCKLAIYRADVLRALGAVVASRLLPTVQAIGGLTMGADPVALSAAAHSATAGRTVDAFVVRKEAKAHGQGKRIEGPVPAGTRVCVVDDVVTSGKSTIEAIRACREGGLEVVQVLALVDREQDGGLAAVEAEAKAPTSAIVTKTEIRAAWDALQR
jgi:orotate phosphoribosyltransferase